MVAADTTQALSLMSLEDLQKLARDKLLFNCLQRGLRDVIIESAKKAKTSVTKAVMAKALHDYCEENSSEKLAQGDLTDPPDAFKLIAKKFKGTKNWPDVKIDADGTIQNLDDFISEDEDSEEGEPPKPPPTPPKPKKPSSETSANDKKFEQLSSEFGELKNMMKSLMLEKKKEVKPQPHSGYFTPPGYPYPFPYGNDPYGREQRPRSMSLSSGSRKKSGKVGFSDQNNSSDEETSSRSGSRHGSASEHPYMANVHMLGYSRSADLKEISVDEAVRLITRWRPSSSHHRDWKQSLEYLIFKCPQDIRGSKVKNSNGSYASLFGKLLMIIDGYYMEGVNLNDRDIDAFYNEHSTEYILDSRDKKSQNNFSRNRSTGTGSVDRNRSSNGNNARSNSRKWQQVCDRWNRDRNCPYRSQCTFLHLCSACFKQGLQESGHIKSEPECPFRNQHSGNNDQPRN